MQKSVLIIVSLSIFFSCNSHRKTEERYNDHFLSQSRVVVLKDAISPDSTKRYFEYCLDIGGSGYSRVFWSVILTKDTARDLSKTLLPDGYKIIGWTDSSKLKIQKWHPYYYISQPTELTTGMKIFDTEIIITN